MGEYTGSFNFKQDLIKGEKGEDVVADVLVKNGYKFISRNNDFKYDLIMEKEGHFTFEVKTDDKYLETGNFFIEEESRGKPSGIEVTEANYFAIHIPNDSVWVIEVSELKELLDMGFKEWLHRPAAGPHRVPGGDRDGNGIPTSRGRLLRGVDRNKHWFKIYQL